MPGGIWEALGRALQTGAQTWGTLKQEEIENQRRDDAMRQEQERFAQQMSLQRENFAADEAERAAARSERERQREAERVRMAYENIDPFGKPVETTPADADLFRKYIPGAQVTDARLPRLNVTEGMPVPGETTPVLSQEYRNPTVGRTPTIQERGAQVTIQGHEQDAANLKGWQDWQTANPTATPQQRFEAANRFNQRFTGMSPDEEQRQWRERQALQHGQAVALAKLHQNYANGGLSPAQVRYYEVSRQIAGSIIARNPRLNALAQAIKEDPTNEQLNQAYMAESERINGEINDAITKQLGPAPKFDGASATAGAEGPAGTQDRTQQVIANLDADIARAGSVQQLKKDVLAKQAQLRAQGVDVLAYIQAIRQKFPTRTPPPVEQSQPAMFTSEEGQPMSLLDIFTNPGTKLRR